MSSIHQKGYVRRLATNLDRSGRHKGLKSFLKEHFTPVVYKMICMKNGGGGTLNDFDIKMMVESNAIDFFQILAAVLDLLANSLLANHHSPL